MKAADIKVIGVIGAGTMGSGIAAVSALSGYRTLLFDVNPEAVSKAISTSIKGYQKLVEKEKITPDKLNAAKCNLFPAVKLEDLSECDVIIEAAVEDLKVKKELYKRLGEITKTDAILATNTSSISVTSISEAVENNNSRVVGMHFFNPANIMKLVEVVKGEFTSDEVMNTTIELCKALGKTPVVCKDTPAFIVNRIARSFYLEPLKIMAEEGLDAKTIDIIMKEEGGFAMGPFELMDLIGIDVNLSVTKSVYEAFSNNPKYKPSPIQQKMVDEGKLGRKTKQGFYSY